MTPQRFERSAMNSAGSEGFVLHTLAWRETSLIIEVFTRDYGRLGMVARGARRPRSALRGLLQPFQPLELRWSGKAELRNLISAEWKGGLAPPTGDALMAGFYLNELLVRLLPREYSHPQLFDTYSKTLMALSATSHGGDAQGSAVMQEGAEPILRSFECALLREMGYAPTFDRESATGKPIDPKAWYRVSSQTGITPLIDEPRGEEADVFSGSVLLALASEGAAELASSFMRDSQVALQCKRLLRQLLAHHLGEGELQSREVVREMYRI